MVEAVMNFLLFVFAAVVFTVWVYAAMNSGRKCHAKYCERCPYAGDCSQERRKEELE